MPFDNNNNKSVAINGFNNNNNLRLQLSVFRNACEVSPELSDIIEIDRTLYTHWALYVGDGYVVHIVGDDDQDFPDTQSAVVKKVKLTHVVADNYCRINNKEVPAKERSLSPLDPQFVVNEALQRVGSVVEYNLLTRNCEHYLTQWKYGQSWSDQAAVALTAIKALRREHKDSTSGGHSFLVNTLNEVLNSPGANSSPSPPTFIRPNSTFSSASSQTEATHVI